MKTLLILFLFLLGFQTELNAQDLVKPVASKWIEYRLCYDPLNFFQLNDPTIKVNTWELILEKVNANQLDAYREENNNMKSIDYSVIADKNTVPYYFGQFKEYSKEDYFQVGRNTDKQYTPIKAVDGSDSVALFEGELYYVYPPPEKSSIVLWDITGIRLRFDSVPGRAFRATWIGFEYQNTAMEEAVWFKLEDLKKTITTQFFVDWLDKLEQSESIGFQYMRMDGSCPVKSGDPTCLKAITRYVSVMNIPENSVLFEHRLDTERSCLLTFPNQFLNSGLTSDYHIRSGWDSGIKTYNSRAYYEKELLDTLSDDLYTIRIFSHMGLYDTGGEDSMTAIDVSSQSFNPVPNEYAFNLSDWNEIRIREMFNEETQSFEPNLITYVITKGNVSFELLHIKFWLVDPLIENPENYDWFQFIKNKKYSGEVFYQY